MRTFHLLWLSRLLAAAAAGVSGYLLWVSLVEGRMPAGCGGGSGCASVLTSRWSSVLGLPVSAPALVLYLTALGLLFAGGPGAARAVRRVAWNALTVLTASVLAAAVWFIGLQAFALKAYCPWCLTDHALGIALSALVLTQAFRPASPGDVTGRRVTRPEDHDDHAADDADDEDGDGAERPAGSRPAMLACLAGMGVSATALLIGLQLAVVPKGPPVKRLAADRNDDTGPGPERKIAVLKGTLPIDAHETPTLGSPDAPKLLVVLFDYRCLYCRATHGYLAAARQRYRDQFGVVLLPMPMEKKCNPHIDETEERFVSSCDVARLALAVWRADRAAYARFDEWLFEPDYPPTLNDARTFAETLVPPEKLAAALGDPWIDAQIQRNVKAYHDSGADRIPVILSPGFSGVEGRPASEEVLFGILERDLGVAPR